MCPFVTDGRARPREQWLATARHSQGRGLPHGSQDDLVQQAAVQPLGHLQPVHSTVTGVGWHDAQAAEHREHHGVAGLVEGTLPGPGRERGWHPVGVAPAQPSPAPGPSTRLRDTWLRSSSWPWGSGVRALSVHLASQ